MYEVKTAICEEQWLSFDQSQKTKIIAETTTCCYILLPNNSVTRVSKMNRFCFFKSIFLSFYDVTFDYAITRRQQLLFDLPEGNSLVREKHNVIK